MNELEQPNPADDFENLNNSHLTNRLRSNIERTRAEFVFLSCRGEDTHVKQFDCRNLTETFM